MKGIMVMVKKATPGFINSPLVILMLICLAILPDSASTAEEPAQAAVVVAVRGAVEAVDDQGAVRHLAVKSPLFRRDTVKTGKRGRIQILFTDNTIISLGRNSEMQITAYEWQENENRGALQTAVKEGAFRVMGGRITKASPRNFSTRTPLATIGIRGSMYAGSVSQDALSVLFQGGRGITVTNPFGTVAISEPGYGTSVGPDTPPEVPHRFTEKDIKAINRELGAGPEQTEDSEPADVTNGDEEDLSRESETGDDMVQPDLVEADIPPANEFAPALDTDREPPPPLLPEDGITGYLGRVSGSSVDIHDEVDAIDDLFSMEINWHNKKVLGRIHDREESDLPPVFFIAGMEDHDITDLLLFGSDVDGPADITGPGPDLEPPPPPEDPAFPFRPPLAVFGTGSGEVSGDDHELLTFTATGAGYEIPPPDQPLHTTWTVEGRGTREPSEPDDLLSPRGSADWRGFAVGLSENLEAIDVDRRLFMSKEPGDFVLFLDRDLGTVSGSLTVADTVKQSGAGLSGLTIGGPLPSAYVLDDNLAAILGCEGGACVETGGVSGDLKEHGNFLVSVIADDSEPFAEYASWGYWEIAYDDPETGNPYHTHVPGSMWVAGELTPVEEVRDLDFTGHYHGRAYATRIDPTAGFNQATPLRGDIDLSVDFTDLAALDAVRGHIDFPGEPSLEVTAGGGPGGFTGRLTNADVAESRFNGAFFGPDAASVAGNFQAEFQSGVTYLGIYGADR